ncbi:MAG: hypothetical protein KVP17_001979 [Porospora cf. gigantea B]|nr:MAG: hypothetical protein KVP17_001979 [Porospora cf. gigantea B]
MSLSDVALDFEVSNCFLLGSPLAGFLSFAAPSVLFSPGAFQFPSDVRLYNIYHPQDPVAFRLEPLLYPQIKELPPPVLLSYWRNNGRRNYYRWDKKWQSTRSSVGKGLQRVMSAIFGKDETPGNDSPAYAKPKTDKRRRYGRLNPVYVEGSPPVPIEAMEIFRTTLAKCHVAEGKLPWGSVTTTKDADTTSVGAINETPAWSLGTLDVEGGETESVASLSKIRLMDWVGKLSLSHDCMLTPEDEIFNRLKRNGLNDAAEMTSDVEEDNGPEDLPTRVDFCVQERLLEHYNSYLAYITSHFIYFSSKDVAFFILKELTGLRPKVCYSDLLLVLETAQQEARLASRAGSETASVDQG